MPRPPRSRNPRTVSRPLVLLTVLVALTGARVIAQAPVEEILKRPIVEAGVDSAATAVVPRAVPVNARDSILSSDAAPAEPLPKAKGATEITANAATFDNKKHEAIFIEDVKVTDPEFSLTCDRLVALLKNKSAPPTERSPAAAPKPPGKSKGGLDRAIAEGNVVIKQSKVEEDGSTSVSIGRAKRADYNAVTGDIVLSGTPFVQQGLNQCIATSPQTIMTLNRDRNMKVDGPHRLIISDKAEMEK